MPGTSLHSFFSSNMLPTDAKACPPMGIAHLGMLPLSHTSKNVLGCLSSSYLQQRRSFHVASWLHDGYIKIYNSFSEQWALEEPESLINDKASCHSCSSLNLEIYNSILGHACFSSAITVYESLPLKVSYVP